MHVRNLGFPFTTIPLKRSSGVYVLLRGESAVYVGQSIGVHGRVQGHYRQKVNGDPGAKDFDWAVYTPVPPERLNDVERMLIDELKPTDNGIYRRKDGTVHPNYKPVHRVRGR